MPTKANTVDTTYNTYSHCHLYPSDADDERSSVDLGGTRITEKKRTGVYLCERRITKKKKHLDDTCILGSTRDDMSCMS